MTAVTTYPAAVAPLVDVLLDGMSEALGENLTGVYEVLALLGWAAEETA